METEEIMENQELVDQTEETYEVETEDSGNSGLGKGIAIGALLTAATYVVGKKVIKPAINKAKAKIAERKANTEAKKAGKKSFVIVDDSKEEVDDEK